MINADELEFAEGIIEGMIDNFGAARAARIASFIAGFLNQGCEQELPAYELESFRGQLFAGLADGAHAAREGKAIADATRAGAFATKGGSS